MVSRQSIQHLSRRIAQEFNPERIILFGSHARSSSRDDSDVDLLVILRFEGAPLTKSHEILTRVAPDFAVDLLVRTPEDVQRRLALNDFFMRDIVTHGEVLYESAHA